MAKAPVAGRSKTRLCPPCTPSQAAEVAEAALADTLDAVAACPAGRRVIALDGAPGPWLPEGVEVIPQRGHGLGERLAAVFSDLDGPLLLVGMDTPQLTPDHLATASARLVGGDVDAVLGHASDGGWWALGMTDPDPGAFDGVPMSSERTGACQEHRLHQLGLRVGLLEELRDVDRWSDAVAVAAAVPDGRFAGVVHVIGADR
jgi:rSAM/selenodomain-associated transferase 1